MSRIAFNPEATERDASTPPLSPSESAYQTPTDSHGANLTIDPIEEQQDAKVQQAGQALQNMVNDWMRFLQGDAEVTMSGEVTIKLNVPSGVRRYNITLLNNDDDPTNLDMRIQRDPEYPSDFPNGLNSRKRSHTEQDTSIELKGGKRVRTESRNGGANSEKPYKTPYSTANPNPAALQDHPLRADLENISTQIRWVEDCRRTYSNHHHRREENWRSSTATFLDNFRVGRETHEQWVVREMYWQRHMLSQILGQLNNGAVPDDTVMRWETPLHLSADPDAPRRPGPVQGSLPGANAPRNIHQTPDAIRSGPDSMPIPPPSASAARHPEKFHPMTPSIHSKGKPSQLNDG